MTAPPLTLHPDRLFPVDPTTREIARRLHATVVDAPIISPHGHVDATVLVDDEPFADPAALFVTPDHYVTRLLHAQGVDLADLGVAETGAGADPRKVWHALCSHWTAFRGTPSRYWLESEFAELFGVTVRPSAETADAIYEQVAAKLAEPGFRPRALFERFRIEVLATTDDPASDLAAHRTLAADPDIPRPGAADLPRRPVRRPVRGRVGGADRRARRGRRRRPWVVGRVPRGPAQAPRALRRARRHRHRPGARRHGGGAAGATRRPLASTPPRSPAR